MTGAAPLLVAGALSTTGAWAQSSEPSQLVAQSSDPFLSLVGKRRERRADRMARVTIERYVLASDDRAFLLQETQGEARVQFLCAESDQRIDCLLDEEGPAPEVYLLRPTRGPRGDRIYKNAEGDTMLRIASYGGATVYWPGSYEGYAASKSFGDDAALVLAPAVFETAARRAKSATAIISAITGSPIIFDIGAPTPETPDAAVLADAVMRTAKGLKDVADDPTGARIIAGRIGKIAFIRDAAPRINLDGDVLEIHYAPNLDIAGRPSSAAISRFLEETL